MSPFPSRPRRLRLAATLLAVLLTLAGAFTACDPCSGVVGCTVSPRASVSGRLVLRASGKPVSGVRLELVPVAGPSSTRATAPLATATTDAAGEFRLVAEVPAGGELVADVFVTPPAPHRRYVVRGLRFPTSERTGAGTDVGRWVVDPYVSFIGQVTNRRTRAPIAGAGVTAFRVGGVPLAPVQAFSATDGLGRFVFGLQPADSSGTIEVGDAIVDILVVAPGVAELAWQRGLRIPVEYRDLVPSVGAVFPVGASLEYQGEVVFRGTGRNVTAGTVEFRRTGGVATEPASVVSPIAPNGRFMISMSPASDGEVVGDLYVRRPGLAEVRIPDIRLATYDSNSVRLRRFSFGEQFLYVGEIHHRGIQAPLEGANVEFRRTGGLAIEPAVLTGRTDASGRFPLMATVQDSGTVVGDLTVTDAAGDTSVYRGVRVRTFASDEVRLAGVWGVGEHLAYVGELWSNTTRRQAQGVTIEFRRTGGIAITPERLSSVTDAGGRFSLFPKTRERGEVLGDLVVLENGADRTVASIRLKTFPEDEVRLAGVWGFGPSLFYVAEILRTDANIPVVGARIEIERTGGIDVTPERTTAVTDQTGRFPLGMTPRAYGEVVATVRVTPPAPWADTTYVFPDVRAATFENGELRLLTVLRIPPPPR